MKFKNLSKQVLIDFLLSHVNDRLWQLKENAAGHLRVASHSVVDDEMMYLQRCEGLLGDIEEMPKADQLKHLLNALEWIYADI
jgi:hypothetical protein